MEIKVYSAIVGETDKRQDDIQCFEKFNKFKLDVYNAKIYKILPHLWIDADISIWIDGNIGLNATPEEIVDEMLGDADMGVFKHFARNCIYKEVPEAQGRYRGEQQDIKDAIHAHADHYMKAGYPRDNGLYECNVLVRRHNKKMEAFNNAWWAEICRHSNRDQISFPYVLDKHDINIKINEGDVRKSKLFNYKSH